MKKVLVIAALALALGVGGCKVHKDPVAKKQDRAVMVAPKASLESLDARVSDLERSRAAARAAFKRAQQPAIKGF